MDVRDFPMDWWTFALTGLGIVATVAIALLTLRATRIAEASRTTADAAQTRALEAYVAALNTSETATNGQIRAIEALVERVNGAVQTPETETASDSEPKDTVMWSLERDSGAGRGRWMVRNVGTAIARATSLHGLTDIDNRDLYVFGDQPRDLDQNGFIQFSIERSMASPPATVVVLDWTDAFGKFEETRMVVA